MEQRSGQIGIPRQRAHQLVVRRIEDRREGIRRQIEPLRSIVSVHAVLPCDPVCVKRPAEVKKDCIDPGTR